MTGSARRAVRAGSDPPADPAASAGTAGGALPALLVGLAAAILGYLGAGVPAYWGDEAASIMSAERDWASLGAMLGRVDAVHGVYYAFLHVWIDVFGASEWSTRAPSAIAVGFLAAGTVVLGTRWFGPRVGLVAGVVCALLPRTTYLAVEARPYALAAAAAVWLTVAFVALLGRGRTGFWRWALYGLGLGASVWVFLHLALLAAVHAVALATMRPRASRATVRGWLSGLAVAALVALPLALAAIAQQHQLAYLAERDWATPGHVLVTQWFAEPVAAVVAWAFIVTGVVAVLLRARGLATALPAGFLPTVAWIVLPTALLLLVDALVTKSYSPRYVSFCVPAVAMLVALGIDAVARAASARLIRRADVPGGTRSRAAAGSVAAGSVAVIALAVMALAVAPVYLAQRSEFAKDGGIEFRAVADVLRDRASPGDVVVFGPGDRPSREPRLALRLYPEAFAGLVDVQLRTHYSATTDLWDVVASAGEIAREIQGDRVWAVVSADGDRATLDALEAVGFVPTDREDINRVSVLRLERTR